MHQILLRDLNLFVHRLEFGLVFIICCSCKHFSESGKVVITFISQDFMSELDIQIPTAFDPFAGANAENSGAGAKEYVHVRIQDRNGRKSLTTVQGLKKQFSYSKILKRLQEGVLL